MAEAAHLVDTGPGVGEPAPDFCLTSDAFEPVTLSALRGRPVVLVFVPMAFSPTCEGEFCALRDDLDGLARLDACVLGVSVDSRWVLKAWGEQQRFGFPLLADFHPKGEVARRYGAYDEHKGYARRRTFVIDRDGIVRDVVASDQLKVARDLDAYRRALDRLARQGVAGSGG